MLVEHLGGGQAAALGEQQIRRVHIEIHLVREAENPQMGGVAAADDLLPEPLIGAADDHQPVVLGEDAGQGLGQLLHGARAHGPADQDQDAALLGQAQGLPGLGLGPGLQEAPAHRNSRGHQPVLRDAAADEFVHQGRMGDEVELHVGAGDAGAAGVVRGHEVAGGCEAAGPGGLGDHDGREHMDADNGVAACVPDGLDQLARAGGALGPQVAGHMVLLEFIAQAEEPGGLAVEQHMALADEPGLGRGEQLQAVADLAAVAPGGELFRQSGGGGIVAAAGITGENQNLHGRFPPLIAVLLPAGAAWAGYSAE